MAKIMGDHKDEKEQIVKDLELKNEELTNNWKRALADYQNLEKRADSQRRDSIKQGVKEFVRELLVVLDSLYKADKHLNDQGLKLAINEFEEILKKHGIIEIDTLNKTFDPVVMECIEVANGEEGKVVEELRKGYLFGEVLLRPAQVKVGKKVI